MVPERAWGTWGSPDVTQLVTNTRPPLPHSPSKKKMQHISNLSIAVMYIMYFLAALFGYLTFYGMVALVGRGLGQAGGKGLVVAIVLSIPRHVVPGCSLLLWR